MQKDVQEILAGLIDKHKGWESLSASDWVVLLCASHEYVAKCDAANGWQLFTVRSWFELLKNSPDYKVEFNKHFVARDGWKALDEYDWINLMRLYPSQANEYRHHIHNYDAVWEELLNVFKNPRLGMDWFGSGCEFFNDSDWLRLLKMSPAYSVKCDEFNGWSKIALNEIVELFKTVPELIDRFHCWENFYGVDWVRMLEELPQLVGKCDSVNGWGTFDDCCCDWWLEDRDDTENCWAHILARHPEFSDRCDKLDCWGKFRAIDWTALLKEQPQFGDRCDKCNGWSDFKAKEWTMLLIERPQFSDRCDKCNGWMTLEKNQWVRLLQKHAQFSEQCDANGCWRGFNGFDWVELLREQPIFVDKCDTFDGWQKLDFAAISCGCRYDYIMHGRILNEEQEIIRIVRIDGVGHDCKPYVGPSEYSYYDENGKVVKREQDKPPFCGRWAELLEKQPQFAKKCDEYNGWEAFDGFDWYILLSAQPSFVERCNELGGWEKMFHFRPKEYCYSSEADEFGVCDNWSEYSYETLYDIPTEYGDTFGRGKRLATKPRPNGQSVLPVYCWMRPEYCKVCRSQKELDDEENWQKDMVKSPEKTLDSQQSNQLNAVIKALLKSQPSPDPYNIDPQGNIEHYRRGVLSELEVREIAAKLPKNFWVYFLNQNPRAALAFAEKYGEGNVWELFTIDDWKVAIENRTDFVNEIYSFEGHDAFADALLSAWPDFLDHLGYCPKEDAWRPDAADWVVECQVWPYLIRHRPDLAVHMNWDDWERLSEHDWKYLLHPRWHYIERATVPMDERHWWLCLSKAPQLATLCEQHGGWSKLSNYYLCDLIDKHSNLLEYCVKYLKWDELTSSDWLALFAHENESKMFVTKCDKHNGWEKFATRKNEWDCLGWVDILKERPDLASKCDALNGWPKFNGTDWQVLLSAQPQLAGRCDVHNGWKTLGEGHWMRLINRQPHFADKYNKAHAAMGIETQPEAEVVDQAKEFVKQEQSRIKRDRQLSEYESCGADYEDWREASGWNDVYGSDVEASDIIDFGD